MRGTADMRGVADMRGTANKCGAANIRGTANIRGGEKSRSSYLNNITKSRHSGTSGCGGIADCFPFPHTPNPYTLRDNTTRKNNYIIIFALFA